MLMMTMMMMTSPDKDLDGEPGVADALDVEEGVVGVGAVLVQRPVGDVTTSRRHCDVPGSFNEPDDDDMKMELVCLIMGTLMSGCVFKQKERMEMQMKNTEITPIT